jgi:acetyl esterase/lipase
MKIFFATLLTIIFSNTLFAQLPSSSQSKNDILEPETIYGHRDGMALTMRIVRPKKSNGKAIVSLVSSGFGSDIKWLETYYKLAIPFLNEGYTVFLTLHSACPRYSIPDAFEDIQRAIQFVRYNSGKYRIDPYNIGMTGSSSGGVLALLAATSSDTKKTISEDPIEMVSSRIQAVAVFYPGTDFLNFGENGKNIFSQTDWLQREGLTAAFNYTRLDTVLNTFYLVTDTFERKKVTTQISPSQLVTSDDTPACIIHGDKDDVVPLQQSQLFKEKMIKCDVPVSLIIKKNGGHGWTNQVVDEGVFVEWFNKYLKAENGTR